MDSNTGLSQNKSSYAKAMASSATDASATGLGMSTFLFPLLLLLPLLLSSCTDMDMCYYKDDFGDSGDSYTFYIYANESNCSYDTSKTYADNTNQTIKTCLQERLIKDNDVLEQYEHPLTANLTCKDVDKNNMDTVKQNSAFSGYDSSDSGISSESLINGIYSACVNVCQNVCKSNASSSNSEWVKAKLKDDNSYVGIKISKDTYLTIAVTGTLNLNQSSKSSAVYTNTSGAEITSNFIVNQDPLDFNIKVSAADASNLLAKTYMEIVPFDASLIMESYGHKYWAQKPLFSAVSCIYGERENERNSAACSFKFRTISELASTVANDRLDIINAKYNGDWTTHVFSDGDFYKYSNAMMDKISFGGSSHSIAADATKIVEVSSKNEVTLWGSSDIDGYIWNDSSKKFNFSVSKPVKVAFKIASGGDFRCTYRVAENMTVEGGGNGDNKFLQGQNTAAEKTFTISNSNWHLLKYENQDLVFNIYNTVSSATSNFKSTVTINYDGSDTKCYTKVLIKVIPLKEIEITKNGFLAFHTPSISQNGGAVSYTVLNPKVLGSEYTSKIGIDNITREELNRRFFEDSGIGGGSSFETVNQLTTTEVSNFDKNTLSYNENKLIFVRAGQVIRLDYSNWFEIEDKPNIVVKNQTLSANTGSSMGTMNLDYGIGLNYFLTERRLYLCHGAAEEEVEREFMCSSIGGSYSKVQTESGEDGVCYVQLAACRAGANLNNKLLRIDIKNDNCEGDSTIEGTESDMPSLWNKIYTAYQNMMVCEGKNDNYCNAVKRSSKCSNPYDAVISGLYKEVIECAKIIKDEKNYQVFWDTTNASSGASYKKKVDEEILNAMAAASNDDTVDKKIENMIKFFNTTASTVGSGDSTSTIYRSSLSYYRTNYCDSENTQGNACKTSVSQCYNLENSVGNMDYLMNDIKLGTSNMLSMFKVVKMDAFSAIDNSGLMKNFSRVSTEESAGIVTNYKTFSYGSTIYPSNSGFVMFYIIEDPSRGSTSLTSTALLNNFKNDIWNGGINWYGVANGVSDVSSISNWTFKIDFETTPNYRNGERLAVFLGDDSASYSGLNILTSQSIMPIVKYSPSGNSYEFDRTSSFNFSDGVLQKAGNSSIGIDFANEEALSQYVERLESNNKQPTLFFKIIDTDDKISNNSGNYQIKIKTVNLQENTVIGYFKSFFNTILSFVDGSYISLENENNHLVKCNRTNNAKGLCYIYDPNTPLNNGHDCSLGDSYCYNSCSGLDYSIKTKSCKQYADGKGFVKNIYLSFVNNPLYQFIAKLALALAITLYGFGYFFGISGFTQGEIIGRIIRYCFIYFMISANGWNFFNKFIVKFFKDGIDSVLFLIASAFDTEMASSLSIAVATKNYSDKSVLFTSCFNNIELLFSMPVFSKILGLAFSSWFGLIYLYLVLSTVVSYLVGVFSSMVLYLTSQLYISLVLCFFPLVLLFMFFERTKKTLDNWINLLVGFVGQQIFLVMTLSFFNILVYNFIKSTFSYTVCWRAIFNMNIAGIPLALISFWKIPSSSSTNGSLNTINENMPSFYSIMSFYIVGILMSKFISGMVEIGQAIFGGAMGIGGGLGGMINGVVLGQAGEAAKVKMKNLGTGFVTGIANRMGGDAISDYNQQRQKARNESKEKRQNLQTETNKKTDETMNSYRNSAEFQHDVEQKMRENEGMSRAKAEKQVIDSKRSQVESGFRNQLAQDIYKDDIQKMMNSNADRDYREYRDFDSLSNADKARETTNFLQSHGLLKGRWRNK